MIINLTRIDPITGERKEVFNLTSEKIKEYAAKAGTFVLVNGLLGKVLPARRNLTKLVNAGMAAGITKLIFDMIEKDQSETKICNSFRDLDTSDTCNTSAQDYDEIEKGYVKLAPREDISTDEKLSGEWVDKALYEAFDEKIWEDEETDTEVKEDASRGLEGDWRSHD